MKTPTSLLMMMLSRVEKRHCLAAEQSVWLTRIWHFFK